MVTALILKGIALVMPLRAEDGLERVGMDLTLHAEEAYATGDGAILLGSEVSALRVGGKLVTMKEALEGGMGGS